jgi:hypothetical protein
LAGLLGFVSRTAWLASVGSGSVPTPWPAVIRSPAHASWSRNAYVRPPSNPSRTSTRHPVL